MRRLCGPTWRSFGNWTISPRLLTMTECVWHQKKELAWSYAHVPKKVNKYLIFHLLKVKKKEVLGISGPTQYSNTNYSPESIIQLKTGWAQDSWFQWSYKNWYFYLDISHWLNLYLWYGGKFGVLMPWYTFLY